MRRPLISAAAAVLAAAGALTVAHAQPAAPPDSNTPIKHVVVIFDENESFDHYFGTYPDGDQPGRRPAVHGRRRHARGQRAHAGAADREPQHANPRGSRCSAVACDQNHAYGAEQEAFDNGAMDKFVAVHRRRRLRAQRS